GPLPPAPRLPWGVRRARDRMDRVLHRAGPGRGRTRALDRLALLARGGRAVLRGPHPPGEVHSGRDAARRAGALPRVLSPPLRTGPASRGRPDEPVPPPRAARALPSVLAAPLPRAARPPAGSHPRGVVARGPRGLLRVRLRRALERHGLDGRPRDRAA